MNKKRLIYFFSIFALLAVCLSGQPAVNAAVVVGPYLQNPSRNSITIMWITDKPEVGRVIYGETKDVQIAVAGTVREIKYKVEKSRHLERYIHTARIENLAPGTRYYYRVDCQGNDGKLSGFRTMPEGKGKFACIIYGDNRTRHLVHRKLASAFLSHNPAFLINTGDLSRRGKEYPYWEEEFFKPLDGVIDEVPIWPCVGNHDLPWKGLYRELLSLPGKEQWYSFDYVNVHFICLNSCVDKSERLQMVKWLNKDLASEASSNADWRIVYFHYPLFTMGEKSNWGHEDILPLLKKYNVDIVFNGHDHNYQRFFPIRSVNEPEQKPLTCIVTGGGGGTLRDILAFTGIACGKKIYHYCVLSIDGQRLHLEAIDIEGNRFDELKLTKEGGKFSASYINQIVSEELLISATRQK